MDQGSQHPELRQELTHWQIFFIVCTAVIGGGIFNNAGEALEIAGPGGFLLALFVMGVITFMVMEGVSEFTQLFPAHNAIVLYVGAFVDPDLAWVAGIAYWYTYSATFAVQNLTAAHLSTYWGLSHFWQIIIFYFFAPGVTTLINLAGVELYGWIESIFGIVKISFVVLTSILLYVIAAQANAGSSSAPVNDGFQANKDYASSHSIAVAYVIPILAYAFLGVETVVVTAFEAKRSNDLKVPSQIIAFVVFVLYILIGLGEALDIAWNNHHLPTVYSNIANNTVSTPPSSPPHSSSLPIIACWDAGYRTLAGVLNGFLIFSVLSAANTSLFVATRTMYGLALSVPDRSVGHYLRKLSVVVFQTRVPAAALCLSAMAFFWLPFLQIKGGYAVTALIEIMAVSASISCLVVWASLSLAFVRYTLWLGKYKDKLNSDQNFEWVRGSSEYKAVTLLSFAQPGPAIIGGLGCVMVLVLASATWWSSPANFSKVAVAYAALVIFVVVFIVLKIFNRFRGGVKLQGYGALLHTINTLKYYKREEVPRALHAEVDG